MKSAKSNTWNKLKLMNVRSSKTIDEARKNPTNT